jgi:hypothetical protein
MNFNQLSKYFTISISLFIIFGCTSSSDKEDQIPHNTPSTGAEAVPVYNQAYQENYEADTVSQIISNAKNAYILVDPFEGNIYQEIETIKANNNQVAGYISAGTGEDWRSDFDDLKSYLSTKEWPEWEGEYFVSETTTGIVEVMKRRIEKMAAWGLDWVEFDNMDWLNEESRVTYELNATVQEAQNYINTLCNETHAKGMKCMAKNTVEGFETFDGVLYESYSDEKNWWDTEGTKNFLDAEKLVIINHYNESDCDAVYTEYKSFYNSEKLSFICEDIATKKYKHYNQ